MSGATSKQIGPAPGAAGGMTRLAYARAKQAGIGLEPLLKKAGLEQGQVEDVNARLRVRSQIAFLNLVAEALSDEFLGFHRRSCGRVGLSRRSRYLWRRACRVPHRFHTGERPLLDAPHGLVDQWDGVPFRF